MNILLRRLLITALTGLTSAIVVGTLAGSPGELFVGILALGLGMVVGILYYVLAPIPPEEIRVDIQNETPLTTATPGQHSTAHTSSRPAAPVINLAAFRCRLSKLRNLN